MSFFRHRNIALKDLYSFWLSSESSFKRKLLQHQWVIIAATTYEPDIPVAVEDLEIETTPPSKQQRNRQCHQGLEKTMKPLNLTTSTQSLSKQTQLLLQRFFSISWPKFGKTKGYHITGTRPLLLESWRKAHQTIGTTGVVSLV